MLKGEIGQNINYFDHGYKNNLVPNMGEILEPKESRISKIRKLLSINHHELKHMVESLHNYLSIKNMNFHKHLQIMIKMLLINRNH